MEYLFIAIVAVLLSTGITMLAIRLLPRFGWMDRTEAHSIHQTPKPRGGGIAIYVVFVVMSLLLVPVDKYLLGLLGGGTIVFLTNFLDDKYRLHPITRLAFEVIACLIVIFAGIGIVHISNPFTGEAIALDVWRIPVIIGDKTHYIVPIADMFAVIWILLFTNAMNWLDGLDGLAGGVGTISALTLFGLSLLPFVNQPDMARLGIVLAGATLGFLIFNFYPSKIKLGDAGSTFIGFTLAVLAIYSSGKIATFFLVLGLPLLDVAWVIMRRLFVDRRSPLQGDQGHIHHRMRKAGLSVRATVLIIYGFSAGFGIIALTLQGAQKKLLAVLGMVLLMAIFGTWLVWREHSRKVAQ